MASSLARVRTKLARARARLVLDRPFVGALALHLPFRAVDADLCDTVATDARAFWFNPEFIDRLSFAETQFALAHEAMHCALGHFARRAHRVRRRWDVSCDHAVNLMLADDGVVLPPGVLANAAFRGLGAEEIYPLIPADTLEQTFDRHPSARDAGADGLIGQLGEQRLAAAAQRASATAPAGSPSGAVIEDAEDTWDDAGIAARKHRPGSRQQLPTLGEAAAFALEQQWKSRVATAAQAAREAGRLGDSWLRALEGIIEPTLPWRALLARHLSQLAREDHSFARGSRREGAAILPRLATGSLRLVAVLDTSGSITHEELMEFAAELDALKGQVRAEVVVHACDERLAADGPWRFAPWEQVVLPDHLPGGGGTRFTPVFEWIERELPRPDLLIYFTDAQGEFPALPPNYPVLWLVKGRGQVPFGERVQLN